MVQLKTHRTTLVLYALLLVLPTAVLGGLHWRQLVQDHNTRLRVVPLQVEDASRRLFAAIEERCKAIIFSQDKESYYAYRDPHLNSRAKHGDTPWLRSNLVVNPRPEILSWFQYDFDAGEESTPQYYVAATTSDATQELLAQSLRTVIRFDYQSKGPFNDFRKKDVAPFLHPVQTLAPFAAGVEQQEAALEFVEEHPALHEAKSVVLIYSFHLRFLRTPEEGTPVLLATRSIVLQPMTALQDYENLPAHLERLRDGYEEIQGFFIDPHWFFEAVPLEEAAAVLGPDLRMDFRHTGQADSREGQDDFYYSDLTLVKVSNMELYRGQRDKPGQLRVSTSTDEIQARFKSQSLRFLGVAFMLTVSLSLGLVLLLRMVHRDLRQAERTENFVAAVTHELRTPLTAIRLYSEMLSDGWVPEESKRDEYYRRILREADRLETLIERVLTKARLSSSSMKVEPGDLNEVVQQSATNFSGHTAGDTEDHTFVLANDLPKVQLNPDAISSIVTNLVENARKYAPPAENGGEPIRIETSHAGDSVIIEVSDRGTGIPASEFPHIFEAFYRIGTEKTRSQRGTGLGLHLVAIQSESMGGKAAVFARNGGGMTFRITLPAVS